MKRKLRWLWLLPAVFASILLVTLALRQAFPGTGLSPEPQRPEVHFKRGSPPIIVDVPAGAQVLTYPLKTGTIVAGCRDATYREGKGYEHYGLDITPIFAVEAEVLASGTGQVLGTEFCDNSLGHIAVVRYEAVYNPTTQETQPLIARYYHMTGLSVRQGDAVTRGQVIGTIDGGHQSLNHTHIEFDTDTSAPFNTPQVAEASSALLNRFPATGASIPDPVTILALGRGQRIFLHPAATYVKEKDWPQFRWNGAASASPG